MDDSQSSDVFPENSPDFPFSSSSAHRTIDVSFLPRLIESQMEKDSYETLVARTKDALSSNLQQEIELSTFTPYFNSILEDCGSCISQSLDLIIGLLVDVKIPIRNLCSYMEDAGCIMQLLSNFLKNILDLIDMKCGEMRSFPMTTGQIIMSVFEHCRDSETLYGNHFKCVEKQLKELFRTCHELQVIYLMILEKHFVFELNVVEEQTVLLEALAINLKIGEIVQNLDVKTMAEQWKAFTMICEKYSDSIKDKDIYLNYTKLLCDMVGSNIRNAMEKNQQDKIVMRSMKVTTFTIKIIIRMLNIFRNSEQNQGHILELLVTVYLHNTAYLENICGKSSQFVNLMITNVTNPSESLLKDLCLDRGFVNCLLKHDAGNNSDRVLGSMILFCNIIKIILQCNEELKINKKSIISCIFNFIPYSYKVTCLDLKFKSDGYEHTGLYEYILSHVFALAVTLDSEEFITLECYMYESLLGNDSRSAMFSSHLWTLIARVSSNQLRRTQFICLCKTYQKLEKNCLFKLSPQETHLHITLYNFFKYISDEDKARMYEEYNIRYVTNYALWTVLRVDSLPKNIRSKVEEMIVQKVKTMFENFFVSGIQDMTEMDNLIATVKLTATCTFQESDDILEQLLTQAWLKACPKCNKFAQDELSRGTVWYLNYVEALIGLTCAMFSVIEEVSFTKILQILLTGLDIGNIELKLTLTNLLCYTFLYQNVINTSLESILIQCLKKACETDGKVKNKLFNSIKTSDKCKLIEKIFRRDVELDKYWKEYGNPKQEWNEQMYFKYDHKCLHSRDVIEICGSGTVRDRKSCSSNFDFADIDSLFEVESDSEPMAKKVKLSSNEADTIITRIENDVLLLSRVKENVFSAVHKDRIRNVCCQLKNIVN